ncbi:MAG: UDP-N-acetyl-D-glucosamine 2-epimerase, UDP-hydrolysing [Bacteroidetes bacterium GWA2_32_17]|nr:MAG: UDP-N-acetyl-D-glucosamine 2-epimerase, UDP-hydrolysing [Bacteroidetes bacterium GWA2_32_17]
MKIGVLTSSRADFGIYLPLLKKIFEDIFFQTEIIAFGTHLSDLHGKTINEIISNNFPVKHQIVTTPSNDTPLNIATSIGKTIKAFAKFWSKEKFDLVFALGDRYEMFAAVTAGSPYNVKFAHLHAGETTLGAIDNSYRHSISLMSEYLFVSTEEYKKRAIKINQNPEKVFNVGALSIDNLKNVELYSIDEFKKQFNIDLNQPTILTTFHPETVALEKNESYISELLVTINELIEKYQIVITMPNSDTMGLMIREKIERFALNKKHVILVESFGMKGYLSCMKYCSFLLGNTSSGFVEAAFFPKYVINIGDRQKGRILTPNIYSLHVSKEIILKTVNDIEQLPSQQNVNIYGDGNAADKIIHILKKL